MGSKNEGIRSTDLKTAWLKTEYNELKPVFSILIIVATLLGLVFIQMEERRLGYALLKMSRVHKEQKDQRRVLEIRLAQATRLEKLESLASKRLTLRRAKNHQVIYLNDFRQMSADQDLDFGIPQVQAPRGKSNSLFARWAGVND